MIAYEPSMLCFTLVRCIEPPLPRMSPDELPMSSPKIAVIDTPRTSVWLWPR